MVQYSGKTVCQPQGQSKKRVFKQRLMPIHETDAGMIVGVGRDMRELALLDLESMAITARWASPEGYWVHGFIDTRATLSDHIYILLTGFNHSRYMIMDLHGDNARTIPIKVDFDGESIHRISGVVGDPLQFIVHTDSPYKKSRVFRIFADGTGESLGEADSIFTWKNRLLVFRKSQMIFYELGEKAKVLFHKEKNIRPLRRKWANDITRLVGMVVNQEYRLFDMETAEVEKLPIQRRPYYYFVDSDGNLRLVFLNKDEISVSEFIDGRIRIEKVWYTSIEGFKIFRVFESGVVVYNREKHEIFLYDAVEDREGGGGQN
jgi:hypothetical protein